MDANRIISELAGNKKIFSALLENIAPEIYTWKQNPGKWNLLEIVCHLLDEEREDFGARVKSTLEDPKRALNPIDPQGWVISRKYSERDYNETLNAFLDERKKSVKYLKELKSPNWYNECDHPARGPMTAGKFLTNWLAHDYLHVRQIIKVKYDYLAQSGGEDLSYAGKW